MKPAKRQSSLASGCLRVHLERGNCLHEGRGHQVQKLALPTIARKFIPQNSEKFVKLFTCLGFVFILASCVPLFEHPLPGPEHDPLIDGEWERVGETGSLCRVFFYPRRNGWLDAVVISDSAGSEGSEGVNVQVFEGYLSRIETERFLCLRKRPPERFREGPISTNEDHFLIMSVDISREGVLNILPFVIDKVQSLIESGTLGGEVKKGKFVTSVRVTDSGESVADLIRKEGVEIFTKTNAVIILKRSNRR